MSEVNLGELRELLAKATPVVEADLMRYEHGGGRLAILRDGQRTLVADFYGDGEDRELFMAMRVSLPSLLDRIEALEQAEAEWTIERATGQRQLEELERALRIRIWNDCKAANMKDDAAYTVIKREMAKLLTPQPGDRI